MPGQGHCVQEMSYSFSMATTTASCHILVKMTLLKSSMYDLFM